MQKLIHVASRNKYGPVFMSLEVAKKNFALLSASFVNKCGDIAFALLPILLVEKNLDTALGATILSVIKGFGIVGGLLGGWLCDVISSRTVLFLSFFVCALGFEGAALSEGLWQLVSFAALAAVGIKLLPGTTRMLIAQNNSVSERQVAIGWLRTVNNGGQILSFSIAAGLSSWGVLAMFHLDAITSLAALILAVVMLPNARSGLRTHAVSVENKIDSKVSVWGAFIAVTLTVGGFTFMYDAFNAGLAGRARILFGEGGQSLFARAMLINTVICTVLAVPAAHYFKNPRKVFPGGVLGLGLGSTLCLVSSEPLYIFVGMFILTLAEVAFTSLASFTMLDLVPSHSRPGATYGAAMFVQNLMRVAGAAVAFPFIIHADQPGLFMGITTVCVAMISIIAARLLPRN